MNSPGAHQTVSPQLIEVNARLWMNRVRKTLPQTNLDSIPDAQWKSLAENGFDMVWLMGVWQRSPAARRLAMEYAHRGNDFKQALPGWTDADITGSPYAIFDYVPDSSLGSPDLAAVKAAVNRAGMRLILDFVPNHVAVDNPWVVSNPDWFVPALPTELAHHPEWYFSNANGLMLAHGRDPNYPPWTDTAQVNFYSPGLREAFAAELLKMTELADGVRCDMAMLGINEIFDGVWGKHIKNTRPAPEFWPEIISRVKLKRPDFVFIAEAYWGFEQKLIDFGFDFAYDMDSYKLLRYSDAGKIKARLVESAHVLPHLAHFIENHDEQRALTAFGRERSKAAAVIISTLPGLRFFHDGQLDGKQVKMPVQLVREPDEAADPEIRTFYERLLKINSAPVFRSGRWQMERVSPASKGDNSFENLLAWSWIDDGDPGLVVVNYSGSPARGWLTSPPQPCAEGRVLYQDELNDRSYIRERSELNDRGLYVALEAWGAHVFRISA